MFFCFGAGFIAFGALDLNGRYLLQQVDPLSLLLYVWYRCAAAYWPVLFFIHVVVGVSVVFALQSDQGLIKTLAGKRLIRFLYLLLATSALMLLSGMISLLTALSRYQEALEAMSSALLVLKLLPITRCSSLLEGIIAQDSYR